MGQLRRGLAGGKALIAVVGHGPVLLSETLFYSYHLIAGSRGAAIHPGDKLPHNRFAFAFHHLACFLLLNGILDHIRKALSLLAIHILLFKEIWIFGLVWIFNIDEDLAQPAVHPPDRRGSHVTPRSACRFCRKRQKAHRCAGAPSPHEAGFAGTPSCP